jgi:hypothetical protein
MVMFLAQIGIKQVIFQDILHINNRITALLIDVITWNRMSCFEGRVKELKNVSIDCFDNSNIYSTTFFLSHCHTGI